MHNNVQVFWGHPVLEFNRKLGKINLSIRIFEVAIIPPAVKCGIACSVSEILKDKKS